MYKSRHIGKAKQKRYKRQRKRSVGISRKVWFIVWLVSVQVSEVLLQGRAKYTCLTQRRVSLGTEFSWSVFLLKIIPLKSRFP